MIHFSNSPSVLVSQVKSPINILDQDRKYIKTGCMLDQFNFRCNDNETLMWVDAEMEIYDGNTYVDRW